MFPYAGRFGCHLDVCGKDPIDIDAFLVPPAGGLGRLLRAVGLRPRRSRTAGLRPLCRGLCLAVTFRAFARYPPVALLRPLLSFGQRSIAYVLPSSPKIRVWTPCALPHMSQASIT